MGPRTTSGTTAKPRCPGGALQVGGHSSLPAWWEAARASRTLAFLLALRRRIVYACVTISVPGGSSRLLQVRHHLAAGLTQDLGMPWWVLSPLASFAGPVVEQLAAPCPSLWPRAGVGHEHVRAERLAHVLAAEDAPGAAHV